ncbi:hypothetical protein ACIQLJ_11870 [Microbacterium sp. NPDC091313]
MGTSSDDLQRALDAASPGDVLQLAPVTYTGHFRISTAATAAAPIVLCGSPGSTLSGGSLDDGYALHLDGAEGWHLTGFVVTEASKGIMLDGARDNVLEQLEVTRTGEEGVHFRADSRGNTLTRSSVSQTGLRTPEFGEGVYVGSAESNWCRYTDCAPDRSDGNTIIDSVITDTAAEALDIKEGTSGGTVRGTTLRLAEDSVADSAVDVKGAGWTLADNTIAGGAAAIAVRVILAPWGSGNVLTANALEPADGGVGIELAGAARSAGNRVGCDNTVPDGGRLTDAACVAASAGP